MVGWSDERSVKYLDLVVAPSWFALPSMASLLSIMAFYSYTGFTIVAEYGLRKSPQGDRKYGEDTLACFRNWVYPGGLSIFVFGINILFGIGTFLLWFGIVFLPIVLINLTAVAIIGGVAKLASQFVSSLKELFGFKGPGAREFKAGFVAVLFMAPILSPSIVFGSMLGWKAYEGNWTNTWMIIRHIYEHVFDIFSNYDDFQIPAFTPDFEVMAELYDHYKAALLDHEPTEYFAVSTGLATLNFVLSFIKPLVLVGNQLIDTIADKAPVEKVQIARIYALQYGSKEQRKMQRELFEERRLAEKAAKDAAQRARAEEARRAKMILEELRKRAEERPPPAPPRRDPTPEPTEPDSEFEGYQRVMRPVGGSRFRDQFRRRYSAN
jgi:hypothetical protein